MRQSNKRWNGSRRFYDMSIKAQDFIKKFESYCPQWLTEEGDPVGLHIGTLDKPIQRVMMTLDVRPEVVAEAIEKKSIF